MKNVISKIKDQAISEIENAIKLLGGKTYDDEFTLAAEYDYVTFEANDKFEMTKVTFDKLDGQSLAFIDTTDIRDASYVTYHRLGNKSELARDGVLKYKLINLFAKMLADDMANLNA